MSNLKISMRLLMSISSLSVPLVAIQVAEIDANISTVCVADRAAAPTPLGSTARLRVVTTRF